MKVHIYIMVNSDVPYFFDFRHIFKGIISKFIFEVANIPYLANNLQYKSTLSFSPQITLLSAIWYLQWNLI